MNLQQHYDLIGQILKERPELATIPITTQILFDPDWMWQVVLYQGTLQIIASTEYNQYGEHVWQPQ